MNKPISIGIPFHNAEASLSNAIRSVFAQTYQDWELILVDDGSTDRSLEIACSVKDSRVRVISDGENRRLPFRLNQIAAEAQYGLIGRMDADDIISSERFEKQIAILDSRAEIDLVTTGVCSLTDDNIPVGVRCGSPDKPITGRGLLLGQCFIVHAAMLGRKAWFLRNPYNESIPRAQDSELWLRAFSKNDFRCYVLPEPLYYFRESGSVSPAKLHASYETRRYLYSQYGSLGFSKAELSLRYCNTYAKSIIVEILSALKMLDKLLEQRNQKIENKIQYTGFVDEINSVLSTSVPGLDTIG